MHTPLADRQNQASNWFRTLRDSICETFETIEHQGGGSAVFQRTPWTREAGDGGEMSLMRGEVFEKVGVNISTVRGEFSESFRAEIPGAARDPRYWASGISLVAHMKNPHVPAAHMNTRMIVVGAEETGYTLWFGGGGDLNPMRENPEDTKAFHAAFETSCNRFDATFYPTFSRWCDEYFFLPHRNEMRGVGGIFYDYLGLNTLGNAPAELDMARMGKGGVTKEHSAHGMQLAAATTLDFNSALAFTRAVGETFRDIYASIIRTHMHEAYTDNDRTHQLMRRGRYVEYNLLYDRGTRFGLMTGGNTEAILMSLPPLATW